MPTVKPSRTPGVSQASASVGLIKMAADSVATARQTTRNKGTIR